MGTLFKLQRYPSLYLEWRGVVCMRCRLGC